MSCIDPSVRNRLLTEAAEPDAWRSHVAACPECRAMLADSEPEVVHPSGAALVRFTQSPSEMDPVVRRHVASHLERCGHCAEALATVPRIDAPSGSHRFALAGFAAAATVALAFFVVRMSTGGGPDGGSSRPADVAVIILASQRGAAAESLPATATLLHFQPVLAEPVAIGDSIRLEIEDEAGHVVVSETVTIASLDPDWGRPVIPVVRARLPGGALKIRLSLASGTRAEFSWTLPAPPR